MDDEEPLPELIDEEDGRLSMVGEPPAAQIDRRPSLPAVGFVQPKVAPQRLRRPLTPLAASVSCPEVDPARTPASVRAVDRFEASLPDDFATLVASDRSLTATILKGRSSGPPPVPAGPPAPVHVLDDADVVLVSTGDGALN